jgi:hypothetical protein
MGMTEDVAGLIEGVVRETFAGVKIESVSVSAATDYNDEAIIKVMVVFDQKGALDARKTSAITRHIRHKLLELSDNRFPITSFVSKSDAASLKPAAA